jgi:2-aminoethylphosphonate-pyruvate transaminase
MSTFGRAFDRPLFTPGPLTTSPGVKQAMLRDLGSRDHEFVSVVRTIRSTLLDIAGVSQAAGWESVIVQGSGTFGIESVISSALPRDGRLLVLVNGAYGERMVRMAQVHGIAVEAMTWEEDQPVDAAAVAARLATGERPTHVAIVHCETTAGIMNPIEAVGAVVREAGCSYIIDSMSAFGGVPTDVTATQCDFLISSSNKCIEGVPGFSFVIGRRDALLKCEGQARTLTLDLHAQWKGLEQTGQFRFTPPTHALLAFGQALTELIAEGGVAARHARYLANHRALVSGMRALGLVPYLDEAVQGPIITSFHHPADPNFDFGRFYQALNDRGYVIYPGKLTRVDCFRIGSIGRLFVSDTEGLVRTIATVLDEMGVTERGPRARA